MGKLVIQSGGANVSVAIGMQPVYIGRSSQNDLVLLDNDVSQRHACAWAAGGRYFIEDLHSRHGTFIDDQRIERPSEVAVGSTLRLGPTSTLRLEATDLQVDWLPYYFVESIATGMRMPVRRRTITLGGPGSDVRLPNATEVVAELMVHDDGRIELMCEDGLRSLEVGEPFECSGELLQLGRHQPKSPATTVDMRDWVWPVRVYLGGADLVLIEHHDGTRHQVRTGNRSRLIILLAEQHQADQAESKARRDLGWAFDADLIQAIWGSVDVERYRNNLNVLIARTRQEIRESGLDPSLVERRQRHVRVRIESVEAVV